MSSQFSKVVLELRNSSAVKFISGAVMVAGVIVIGHHQPVQSAAIYNFRTDPTETTSTRTFVNNGITLIVDNAQGNNILTAIGINGGSGGVNTDINNGLCVALYAGFGTGKCQYNSYIAGDPTLTGLTFTFDKSVYLRSFDVLKPGGVESGSLSFTSTTSSQVFSFTNAGGADTANGVAFASFTFNPSFVVAAGSQMTLSSAGTTFSASQPGSFRISNFVVEEVPGPLPLLGFAGALGWSRQLRKKLN